ncbi:MAG: Rdx family protein [Planctomycetes bacterium]|nr:Rdx family protein [Planctomycetota bacterium]
MTAELKSAYPDCEVKLIPSKGGVFEVTLDGRLLYSKKALDRFPSYQEIPSLIEAG